MQRLVAKTAVNTAADMFYEEYSKIDSSADVANSAFVFQSFRDGTLTSDPYLQKWAKACSEA